MSRVAVLTVTMDRYDLTVRCLGPSLHKAGCPFKFYSWDNGSIDRRTPDYVATLGPVYQGLSIENIGYAPAINQLLLRCTDYDYYDAIYDYFCVIDPDMEMPPDWLKILVEYNEAIPEIGWSGYHCVLNKAPETELHGKRVHCQGIYGVKCFNRRVFDRLGYFQDDFGVYGNEDCEMNRRLALAGFQSYYVGNGMSCIHAGDDCGDKSPYRKMKWDALEHASVVLERHYAELAAGASLYKHPPKLIYPELYSGNAA